MPPILEQTWEQASRARGDAPPGWMTEAQLREACREVALRPETTEGCLLAAAAVRADPALLDFAWHAWWTIFRSGLDVRPGIEEWPLPAELSGSPSARLPPLFWAAVLMAGAHVTFEKNRSWGVPDEVTAATLRDLDLWVHECLLRTGKTGFLELCWLVYHFGGRLFALGRLHFDMRANDVGFHLLAPAAGPGRCAAVAEQGMSFRHDGQFFDADREVDPNPWVSTWSEDGKAFSGFPVGPGGAVQSVAVSFSKAGWIEAAGPSSAVLGVHIPAAGPFHGPMTPGACEESFQRAVPFFRSHFPEHQFRAFTCKSWILDSQLARFLPDGSNIVRFQRRFTLVPVRGASDAQTIERVWGVPLARTAGWDWRSAPRDSRMRETLAAHVAAGGRWRMGGGILKAN
jgi:hypothetical protein